MAHWFSPRGKPHASGTKPGMVKAASRPIIAALAVALACCFAAIDAGSIRAPFIYDALIYQCYAQGFWQGTDPAAATTPASRACLPLYAGPYGPYRSLPREYPAPALGIFSLPLLGGGVSYTASFAIWMALLLVVATGLLAWRGPPAAGVALPLYILLAGWQLVLVRYDFTVGLAILLALVLAERGKDRAAAVALAVGTLLKGIPLLLLPLLVLDARRRSGRWPVACLAVFAGVLIAGMLPWFLVNAREAWAPVPYALNRPLETGSLASLIFWISGGLGDGARLVSSYGSYNVIGPREGILSAIFAFGMAGALAVVYRRQWLGKDSLARECVLALIAILVWNKVFSPQYLLWLLPVAAYSDGVRLRWVVLAALGLFSTAVGSLAGPAVAAHPHLPGLAALGDPAVLAPLGRDLALLCIAASLLRSRTDSPSTRVRRRGRRMR